MPHRYFVLFVSVAILGTAFFQAPPALAADEGPLLTLKEAIARGVAENLDLQVAALEIPKRREGVKAERAAFDPAIEAAAQAGEARILTGAVLYSNDYQLLKEISTSAGIRKRFVTGMRGRVSLETYRLENNSRADALDPQYGTVLLLNLTQPLLKDFGTEVNTTGIRLSENAVRQGVFGYLDRAQQLAAEIERAYWSLAQAHFVRGYRIDSLNLAKELAAGNRERLDQGVISVTQVDQARTAVADREEAVLSARREVETLSNILKDLLEIRTGDPLAGGILRTTPIPSANPDYPSLDEAVASALERRPDLRQARVALAAQDIRLAYFENQKLPRLDLNGTFGLNGLSGDDRPVRLFGGETTTGLDGDYLDAWDRMAAADGYQWEVDLRFSVPIGNRAAESRYARTRIGKQQLLLGLKRLEGGIETEVKNARVAVGRNLERVAVADRFERLAEETLHQEMARLREGLSDTFRILDFQDDLIGARIRKVAAVADFHRGMADLHRAMGMNLERFNIAAEVETEAFPALEGVN
jgi:outer membrane protein TolC